MDSFALEEMKGSVTTWLFVGPPIHSKRTGTQQHTEDGREPAGPRNNTERMFWGTSQKGMFSLRHHEFLLNVNLAATSLLRSKHTVLEKQKEKKQQRQRRVSRAGLGLGPRCLTGGYGPAAAGDQDSFCFCSCSFRLHPCLREVLSCSSQLHSCNCNTSWLLWQQWPALSRPVADPSRPSRAFWLTLGLLGPPTPVNPRPAVRSTVLTPLCEQSGWFCISKRSYVESGKTVMVLSMLRQPESKHSALAAAVGSPWELRSPRVLGLPAQQAAFLVCQWWANNFTMKSHCLTLSHTRTQQNLRMHQEQLLFQYNRRAVGTWVFVKGRQWAKV